ncbi:hypothetical protein FRB95_001529 [Tulasnella sp. JGI-2019a]|nr:hypothetical protein FRB95_001529 [Tulasnella sp. JGI-2019a]
MSETVETVISTLVILVDLLDALPVPDLFKDAAMAIPVIAIRIMQISEGLKRNRRAMKELAFYIADLTNATLRPLEAVGGRPLGPAMEPAMKDFYQALQEVEHHMGYLASRNPWKRFVSYDKDVGSLNRFKDRIEEARRIMTLEISVATLALVGDINAIVTETHQVAEITQAIVEETALVALDTQAAVEEAQAVALKTLDIAEDTATLAMDTLAIVEDTATLAMDTQAIVKGTRAVALDTHAMVVDAHNVATATHHGVGHIGIRLESENTRRLLEKLGTGGSSAADAFGVEERICTPGTRQAILARIERWIHGSEYDKKHILWLKAVAGSGKTAVAGSVEKMAREAECLGARFYFARGQPERNGRCILEIARQLASLSEERLRDAIISAIEKESDIVTSAAVLQYKKLIHQPLLTLTDSDLKLVIVIDAIDECEPGYATKLLELIGHDHLRLPTGVKFFLTSRVEPHIQGELEEDSVFPTVEQLALDVEGSSTVHEDIMLYLKDRLPPLVRKFGIRDKDWPGEKKRMELAQMAGESFIWASTAVLLVTDPNHRNPASRLEYILSKPSLKNLDYLYSTALENAFPSNIGESILSLLHDTLGMLVVARVPITVAALASLLPSTTDSAQVLAERIRGQVLSFLGSVLIFSAHDDKADSKPIQFLHNSFVDFLVTEGRCDGRFLIDVPKYHEKMTIGCLQRMDRLKRNICQLTDPSKLNSEVRDIAQRIHRHIPPALQYACEHWADHLAEVPPHKMIGMEVDSLLDTFVKRALLFWVEAMGLLGRAREAVSLVRLAETWVMARGFHYDIEAAQKAVTSTHSMAITLQVPTISPRLAPPRTLSPRPSTADLRRSNGLTSTLLYDLRRFIMEFMEPIVTSPLHIYGSAVAFMPSETELCRRYKYLSEGRLTVARGRAERWSQTLWTAFKHSGPVKCIAVSPDGKMIVSGSDDNTLRLWDAKTGAAIGQVMDGHTSSINCVAVSPDSNTIVSGSRDCTLRLWHGKTGAAVGQTMEGHTGWVKCVAVSPDGTTIVSGSSDTTLRLWDTKTGKAIGQVLKGHTSSVKCVAISPDSKTIISGSDDTTLRLWDAKTGEGIGQVMEGHASSVNCVAVSPDGMIIASGSRDETLRLWDAMTGVAIHNVMKGHTGEIGCVAISPDSTTIVSGSGDKTLQLWDAKTGEAIRQAMEGHIDWVSCVAIYPDGTTIVSGSDDNTLRMWDAKTGEAIGRILEGHTGWVNCVAVSPDGTTIVSGSRDDTMRVWEAKAKAHIGPATEGHTDWVKCVAVSPDGKTVVSGSDDMTLRLWDAKTGAAIGEVMEGHTSSVSCVTITPDNTTIVSGSDDNTVRLWDAKTGKGFGQVMEGHTGWVNCVAVSPDGKTVVSGSRDDTLCLWDARTGAAIGDVMKGHNYSLNGAVVTPDNRIVISAADDNTMRLWDARTGAAIGKPLEGHTGSVSCVTVYPDGSTIVSGSADTTLRQWDITTGAAIGTPIRGHTNWVDSVAVSPDCTTIVSRSDDKTLRLWDAETGAPIGQVAEEHIDWVNRVISDDNVGRNHVTQPRGSKAGVQQPEIMFQLDGDGWVWGSKGRRRFWLPADLRGSMVNQGNIIALVNQKVPIIHVS